MADIDLNDDNGSAQHEYEDMEPVGRSDDFDTEKHEVMTASSVDDSGMEEVEAEGDYLAPCDRGDAFSTKDQVRRPFLSKPVRDNYSLSTHRRC